MEVILLGFVLFYFQYKANRNMLRGSNTTFLRVTSQLLGLTYPCAIRDTLLGFSFQCQSPDRAQNLLFK